VPGRSALRSLIRRRQATADSLFTRQRSGIYRLSLLIVLSGFLMVVDQNTAWLAPLRSAVGTALNPLEFAARAPYLAGRKIADVFANRAALLNRVTALEEQNQELKAALLRFDAIAQENDTLRALFNSQAPLQHETLIAELIGLSEEPKEAILNKGSRHGVNVGQPVIDAAGLFGQVKRTTATTSRVLLVTDPSHAVPVYVLRNGVRAIAVGDGLGNLTLKYAAATLDVRVGDELNCSGLGGRFPFGYPVGVVTAATLDAAEPFLRTTVQPRAALDRSRHLLVLTGIPTDEGRADGAQAATAPQENSG